METREKFLQIYANLPLNMRNEIILVLDKKEPITWNVAFLEIKNSTPLSKKILKSLTDLNII